MPGDDWYRTVSEWMMACSGAVLLLNRDAEKSPYVQYEASVLSHRWRTDNGAFKLFVALVDPTSDADSLTRTKLSQGALGATRIQHVHIWPAPANLLNDPEGLADALVAATQFAPPTFSLTPWDRTVADMVKCLAAIDHDDLEDAAEAADTQELLPLFGRLNRDSLIRALAAWLLETSVSDPQRVQEFVTKLRYDLGSRRQLFLQALRAAEVALGSLGHSQMSGRDRVEKPGNGAAVAVNGKWIDVYTLECFIKRAIGHTEECPIIRCDEKSHSEDAVVKAIQTHCEPDAPDRVSDDDIANQLGRGRTVCLLQNYPKAPNDDELIRSLSARFRYIVFVAWPGLDMPEGLAAGLRPVNPAIDLALESARRASWRNLKTVIDSARKAKLGHANDV